MITNDHWYDFLTEFFGYDKVWIKHVTSHWNPMNNSPGCDCRSWTKCDEWNSIVASRIEVVSPDISIDEPVAVITTDDIYNQKVVFQTDGDFHSVITPWSDSVVENLNSYQTIGLGHPYTCPNCKYSPKLIARSDGWKCPSCSYTQGWAHAVHGDGSWKESDKAMMEKIALVED